LGSYRDGFEPMSIAMRDQKGVDFRRDTCPNSADNYLDLPPGLVYRIGITKPNESDRYPLTPVLPIGARVHEPGSQPS
jgi:hypothetical protein